MPVSSSATQASCGLLGHLDLLRAARPARGGRSRRWSCPASVRLCGTLEIRFAPCVGCTKKAFGKPCTWMPCLVRMPSAQASDSFSPSRPVEVEAGAALVLGADLEAGRVDDAVDLVLAAADHDALLGDPLDALAVGVDQVRAGLVEGLQVFVVEAGPLAELAVPGLQLLGRLAVLRRWRRTRARISSIFSKSESSNAATCSAACAGLRAAAAMILARMRRDRSVQPSCTRSSSAAAAGLVGGEVLQPALLPAGRRDAGEPFRIDRRVGAHVDRRGRALEDVELPCRPGRGAARHCTAVAPVPMIATRLSASLSAARRCRDRRRCSRSPSGWCGTSGP